MLSTHLEGLREAMVAFVRYADRAGLRAPVPTCPEWKVRRLIAHQGQVHRWAAGLLRGEDLDRIGLERIGLNVEDPVDWLREGALEFVTTVMRAPEEAPAPVFLAESGSPRQFWARRQCHETTIHAVDAQAASLGRAPAAAEADWISTAVAEDGIDELLVGFLTREGEGMESSSPLRLLVAPTDTDRGWLLERGPGPARATRLRGAEVANTDADEVLQGTAAGAYLRLWNRGGSPWSVGGTGWSQLVRI